MGGRGSWSSTMANEQIIVFSGGGSGGSSQKIPASQFQTLDGNKVSKTATFSNVEKQISQHTYETGLIVDNNGFVLAAYKGTINSVNFGTETAKIKGNILTHNHPSNSAAFSVADIRVTGIYGGIGIRATTKSNGTAVLRKKTNNPQWEKLANAYSSAANGKSVEFAQKWLRKNAPKYGLTFTLEK